MSDTGRIVAGPIVHDIYYGGAGAIQGVVTEEWQPGRYRVRLYAQDTGILVRERWSNLATGAYAFLNLAAVEFYVVVLDHTSPLKNAVIQDKVVPS